MILAEGSDLDSIKGGGGGPWIYWHTATKPLIWRCGHQRQISFEGQTLRLADTTLKTVILEKLEDFTGRLGVGRSPLTVLVVNRQ